MFTPTSRKTFLKSLLALLPIPAFAAKNQEKAHSLSELEEAYFKVSNELTRYRQKHGFNPGVCVKTAKTWDGAELYGSIANYGNAWDRSDAHCVPVELFSEARGWYIQPWPISKLEVVNVR